MIKIEFCCGLSANSTGRLIASQLGGVCWCVDSSCEAMACRSPGSASPMGCWVGPTVDNLNILSKTPKCSDDEYTITWMEGMVSVFVVS